MSLNTHLYVVFDCGEEIEIRVEQTPTEISLKICDAPTVEEGMDIYLSWIISQPYDEAYKKGHSERIRKIFGDTTLKKVWEVW